MQSIGLAMVEIRRIQRVLDRRPSWLDRWFGEEEILRARSRARCAEDLAGRFACKLAVRQCLEAVLETRPEGRLSLNEIRTSNDPLGKPLVSFTAKAARQLARFENLEIHVSITHSRDTAAAVAVLDASGPCQAGNAAVKQESANGAGCAGRPSGSV